MKVLCINPNSSIEVTEGIRKTCELYTLSDIKVDVVDIPEAPSGMETFQNAVIAKKYLEEKF